MIIKRIAAAIGIVAALAASQLPEYIQQYRQRLGGALDEIRAEIAAFDAEAARQSLDRGQAVARLKTNPDILARERGEAVETLTGREDRLEGQARAFAVAGPVSQYWVLLTGLDPKLAARAYEAFEPAAPLTTAGLIAGGFGLFAGWLATHMVALPFRRRSRPRQRLRDA